MSRFKQVIGDGTPELRPHRLNPDRGWGQRVHLADPCNNAPRYLTLSQFKVYRGIRGDRSQSISNMMIL